MGTLDRACPFDWNGGGDVGKAQMMEADGGHDNIDDRIDCTDLVKWTSSTSFPWRRASASATR